MRRFDYFWASKDEWYEFNENGDPKVRTDAPQEAQDSYKHYLEQKKRATEQVRQGISMD
ncbi:MAG: hypothetical protein IKR49_08540 [Clostridia bacterium]|nr:hypothetical protein [Clostridia bacterium]